MALAGCGGGGGGAPGNDARPQGGDPVPVDGWTLSGTLYVDERSAVDIDTANGYQNDGTVRNDDVGTAQVLPVPVSLVGSVNQPYAGGKYGRFWYVGDPQDVYKVQLQAGQVIELDFSAPVGSNDLDMVVQDSAENVLADASDSSSQHHCIMVSAAGTYYVTVHARVGASGYNLRIGAPGEGGSCATVASANTAMVPGQVLALPNPSTGAGGASSRLQSQSLNGGATAQEGVPVLLTLPASATARQQAIVSTLAASSFRLASAAALQAGSASVSSPLSLALDTIAYAKALKASGQYLYAEPNRRMTTNQAMVGLFPPNDRNYPDQRWHYEQINLPAAMARLVSLSPLPATRPIVAVVDSGIVSDHPDLAPQVAEGRSFVSIHAQGDGNSTSGDDPSPSWREPVFHGSHVAGTIAAATFDGIGAAGVAPMAQLMPLRVFSPELAGASDYDIIQALRFAAGLNNDAGASPRRKADVINLSLGRSAPCTEAFRQTIEAVRGQGVIVVAASGNDAHNDRNQAVAVGMPANCPGVVAVGALNAARQQASYSQSGAALKVVAPGGDTIVSPNGSVSADLVFSTVGAFRGDVRVPAIGGLMGTSMAAPHVSGVIALMKYVYPALSPQQLDTLLQSGSLTDDLGSAGWDSVNGHGLINARKAVDAALSLANGGVLPRLDGQVAISPSALDFGAFRDLLDIELMLTADTDEKVQRITSDDPALSVRAVSTSSVTGLGTYRVTLDRSLWSVGSHFANLTVRTSTGREITVPVSGTRQVNGVSAQSVSLGSVFVVIIDADTSQMAGYAVVSPVNGRYAWQVSGIKSKSVYVLAGGDLDANSYFCESGEPCGAYPLLRQQLTPIALSGNRQDLNFTISPLSNIDLLGTASVLSLPTAPGRNR
jgi:serine protease